MMTDQIKINMSGFVILTLIPLILSIGLAPALPFADAFESSIVCDNNQILVERLSNGKYACVNPDTAQKWITSGFAKSVDVQVKESFPFEIPTANGQTLEQPNIIVIMGDDVGWYNIGAYHLGVMTQTTPNIDRMAKNGMLFTDYYGDPSCTAARASFVTGQLPVRTGLTTVGQAGVDHGIPAEAPTVAVILKDMGYATGQFGKNHLGDMNKYLPTVHGFDEFYGFLYHLDAMEDPFNPTYPDELNAIMGPRNMIHSWASNIDDSTVDERWGKVGKQIIEDAGPLPPERMKTVENELTDHAIAFMDKAREEGKPFFVYHNPSRVHVFTHLSDYYDNLRTPENGWSIGDAAHKEFDDNVGRLVKYVEDNGIAENTIILVTSDNGAENWTWPDGAQTPFAGGKGQILEGGMRVPMVAQWPAHMPAGKIENGIMSHLDWLPTLVAAAGNPNIIEELKEGKKIGDKTYRVYIDGYNQLPVLTGEGESNRHEIFYFMGPKLGAVRIDDYKYRFLDQPQGWFGPVTELGWPDITNLRLDPLERTGVPRGGANSGSLFATGDWFASEFWRFVFAQQEIEKLAETFVEYPPIQGSASFNLEGIREQAKNIQAGQ
jgi:arylsulfatase